ncbi:MAG: DNA polymerase III subunit delta' [Candidatus Hydrogenedentes bacterium]|nr:DNA polymerase III subunit delta' [Candidatus Hydrogenedentota bacterium]
MSFSHVRDQQVPIHLLQNILRQNRIPNGLLFWGPEGVGKAFTALQLAKALNCGHGADSCDACLSCRKVISGNHPDVKSIQPSGKARNIGVETVEFMNELSSYKPFEGAWRLFMIHDVDRMRIEAQNHFLKTLEEPPSNTIFVLLTAFPQRLLPTIRSRCQQLRFGSLRPETVKQILLKERDLPGAVAEAVAAVAQGQVSRAFALVDTEKREVVLDLAQRLGLKEDPLALSEEFVSHLKAQSDAIRAALQEELDKSAPEDQSRDEKEGQKQEQLAYVEGMIRRDIMEYLYLFTSWYRDELVFQVTGSDAGVFNRDHSPRLKPCTVLLQSEKLRAIERAWVYIERNLSMDRVFRDLFFTLAQAG